MADFSQITQQMEREKAAMGNKPGYILTPLGPIAMEVNVGSGLGLQGKGLNLSNSMIFKAATTGKAGGLGEKFLNACMQAADQVREINKGSPIVYGGDVQSAGGSGLGNFGRGGGFEIT